MSPRDSSDTRRLVTRLWGALLISAGSTLVGLLVYRHWIEVDPAVEGRSPVLGLMIGTAMILLGGFRLMRRSPGGHPG